MSSRRNDSQEAPLCLFSFKDGRRCTQPAHPCYDGFCYAHGTFTPRGSRQDNLLHALAPLAAGHSSARARQRALRSLTRALAGGRISPEQAQVLHRISLLIEQSARFADQRSFTSQSGPAWERLRRAVDDLDELRSQKET